MTMSAVQKLRYESGQQRGTVPDLCERQPACPPSSTSRALLALARRQSLTRCRAAADGAGNQRARVAVAAEELGYRTHVGARNLIRQRTEVIGVVVGDLFDPFCAELTAHIELLAAERGFRMLLTTAGPDLAAEASAITSLVEHRVAAIIVISFTGNQSVLDAAGTHMPVICIGYEGPYGVSIGVDDRLGGGWGPSTWWISAIAASPT